MRRLCFYSLQFGKILRLKLQVALGYYPVTERTALRNEVLDMLLAKSKLLERKLIACHIAVMMLRF